MNGYAILYLLRGMALVARRSSLFRAVGLTRRMPVLRHNALSRSLSHRDSTDHRQPAFPDMILACPDL